MIYHLRQAWLAMRANMTAALATLTTMTLTLTLLGLVTMLTLNLSRIANTLEREVLITAYLNVSASPEEAQQKGEKLVQELQKFQTFGVAEARFVPKEQALNELTLEFPYLAEANKIVKNPLEDRVQVRLQNPRDIKRASEKIRELPNVADVYYGEEFVGNAIRAIDTVRLFGYGLVILLFLNSLFNILNTIRVAMYARRDEINVMRMIGATRGFIRLPYVIEGVGLGLVAGAITAFLLVPSYLSGIDRLQTLAPFLPLERNGGTVWSVVLALLGLGVLVGLLGSIFAANRYLREVE